MGNAEVSIPGFNGSVGSVLIVLLVHFMIVKLLVPINLKCIKKKLNWYLNGQAPAVEIRCDVFFCQRLKNILWKFFEQPAVLGSCNQLTKH